VHDEKESEKTDGGLRGRELLLPLLNLELVTRVWNVKKKRENEKSTMGKKTGEKGNAETGR